MSQIRVDFHCRVILRAYARKIMCVNTVEAMSEESRVNVRVETRSTLTSIRDTSYIASISFTRVRT